MSGAAQLPSYMGMTFSQILSRIYRLLRADFRTQFGIALLPGAAYFVSFGAFFAVIGVTFIPAALKGNQPPAMPQLSLVFAAFTVVMIVHLIALALFLAASSCAAVSADCGIRVRIRESYAIAWQRAGHFVLLILSMYGLCFLPAWLLEALTFGAMAASKAFSPVLIVVIAVAMLLLIAALIGGVVVALRLSLAFPASVFESLNVRESIKRSWALTRGAAGRIFLVMLVVYAAMYLVMMLAMMIAITIAVIGYLALSGVLAHPTTHTIWILTVCGVTVYLGLISVFSACAWAGVAASLSVIYNDQRLRMVSVGQNFRSAGAP